jgi:hypothetical protein
MATSVRSGTHPCQPKARSQGAHDAHPRAGASYGGAVASDDATSRRAERLENAAYHAAQSERQQAEETRQATVLIAEFARAARTAGLATQPLEARPYNGGRAYRTDVDGWYLRRNRSVGVGTDGRFYVLLVPASLRSRLSRAHVEPADPPMVVGKGGRDGESIDLPDLLRMRLDAGDDFG